MALLRQMKAVFGQKRVVGASVRLLQADFVRKGYQVDFKILSKGKVFNLIAFPEKVRRLRLCCGILRHLRLSSAELSIS